MKRAVSISLGSSTRDKRVVVNLGGEQIVVEWDVIGGQSQIDTGAIAESVDRTTQSDDRSRRAEALE